jgi:hypothetical protein
MQNETARQPQSTCMEEEISNNEFQKTIVKMIKQLKEETQS